MHSQDVSRRRNLDHHLVGQVWDEAAIGNVDGVEAPLLAADNRLHDRDGQLAGGLECLLLGGLMLLFLLLERAFCPIRILDGPVLWHFPRLPLPVIVIGLLLCAASLPLIFRSESLTVFLLAAPLLGVGVGGVTPVTNALIADLSSARRLGAAMGVFGTIWNIGEAAGPMIAGFLIGDLGYATTFDVLAAVIALVTVGLMVLVRDPKAAVADRESERPAK
jgi:MFS family permease